MTTKKPFNEEKITMDKYLIALNNDYDNLRYQYEETGDNRILFELIEKQAQIIAYLQKKIQQIEEK